jgi:uncharacterized OsmC-like protein
MDKSWKSLNNQTNVAHVAATLVYGSACDVDLGERALRADLTRERGGSGSGPDPDQLLRASLASSLLISYRDCAVRLGVEVSGARLELDIERERGKRPARWRRIHGRAQLWSTASVAELWRVLELAHAKDAVLASLSPRIARSFELQRRRADGSA